MRRSILLFIIFITVRSAFSMEFTAAPFYVIDESLDQVISRNDFHEKLFRELGRTANNGEFSLRIITSMRHNPPQSVSDAIVLCRTEQIDYLIYGYIIKKDHTIQGELRLLDYERREVIATFYSMDSRNREEELIADLASKLYRFLQETYNFTIIPEPPEFMHLQFPLSLGYWLPVNAGWNDILYGIIRGDGGIQFIPNDSLIINSGNNYYISLGLDLSYRIGMGRFYESWIHGITINTPLLLHRVINEQHEMYYGIGLFYTFDLLYIKKIYEDPALEVFNTLGLMLSIGWEYHINERLFLFADAIFDISFYKNPLISFSPRVGLIFRNYTKEVVRKW